MSKPAPLSFEQTSPEVRELLQPTVDRLGYFGEFFQYAANNPAVLQGFMAFSGVLKKALPDDLNEALALVVCSRMDFPYERIQHERLAEKLGFPREWIAALTGRDSAAELTPLQAAVRDVAVGLTAGDMPAARRAASQVAGLSGDELAIAVLFQATRYMQVCQVGRVLDMQLPVPSIFD